MEMLKGIGLPVVQIETMDGEWPTCDYVDAPTGLMGQSITNKTKVPSRMVIWQGDDIRYDSGEYSAANGLTIALRGNSSAYSPKKPYKLKLRRKADLLATDGATVCASRDWVLLKEPPTAYLCTWVGLEACQQAGVTWLPRYQFVNVVINGDYQGLYMLFETMQCTPGYGIDIDADRGCILEYDAYWWNESLSLQPGLFYRYMPCRFTFQHPDAGELIASQVEQVEQYVSQWEASIMDGTYPDHMDLESFATWLLVHDILGTGDAGGSGLYISRHDKLPGTPFVANYPWDFDSMGQTPDAWSAMHDAKGLCFHWLLASGNKAFAQAYVGKWEGIEESLFEELDARLEAFAQSDEGKAVAASLPLDCERWEYSTAGRTLPEVVAKYQAWFSGRKAWMEEHISDIELTSGVASPSTPTTTRRPPRLPPVGHPHGRGRTRHRHQQWPQAIAPIEAGEETHTPRQTPISHGKAKEKRAFLLPCA